MLGWKIFKRAVRLLLDNLAVVLRISVVPYGIVVALSLFLGINAADQSAFTPTTDATGAMTLPPEAAGQIGSYLLFAFSQVLAFVWIAVAWHRYVLLGEEPNGWIPIFHGGPMLGYVGRSILIGLIVILVSSGIIAIGVFMPLISFPVAVIVSLIIGYRLGIILPAGAIGEKLTLSEAWKKTSGHSGTVMILGILTFAVSFLLQIPTLLDVGAAETVEEAISSPVTQIYTQVAGWLLALIGVGVLTTLYGHLVEGRPVD